MNSPQTKSRNSQPPDDIHTHVYIHLYNMYIHIYTYTYSQKEIPRTHIPSYQESSGIETVTNIAGVEHEVFKRVLRCRASLLWVRLFPSACRRPSSRITMCMYLYICIYIYICVCVYTHMVAPVLSCAFGSAESPSEGPPFQP